MRGGTVLRGYGCAGLAEPVGTAGYLSLDAATLEPVAEPLGGVGLLECCFEEGEAAARRGREDRLELRQDRDHEVDRALVPVLVLAEGQPAAGMDPAQRLADMLRPPYVLPADARDIGDALAQQNEQHQRQVSCVRSIHGDGAVAHLRDADPVLRDLIDQVDSGEGLGERAGRRGMRPDDHYGALVRSIVGQQLSTRAARAIYERLLAHFGGHTPTPDEVLAADPEEMRAAAGLSHAKVGFLRSLAEHVIDGSLELARLQEARFRLRFRSATEAIENSSQIRILRRNIARLKTVLRERKQG